MSWLKKMGYEPLPPKDDGSASLPPPPPEPPDGGEEIIQKIIYLERDAEEGIQHAYIIFDELWEEEVLRTLEEEGGIHPMAAIIYANYGKPSNEVKEYIKENYGYDTDAEEDV